MELGTVTGLPLPTIKKNLENYMELDGGDEDLLRVLGYSKYVIEGPESKKAKSKKKSKKSVNRERNRERDRGRSRQRNRERTNRNRDRDRFTNR